MNSNGVGVPPLCFFKKTFKKTGKEVWKSSFLFCPQPSWMHMNSFVQQGLKPEQHPKPQNVKTTSRREKLFHWFQGKTQSMPHVCSFKNRKLPQSLESNVFQELLCHVFCSSKNPQSLFKELTKRLSSVSVEPFLRTWSCKTPTPLELSERSLLNFFDFVCQIREKQLCK